MTSHILKNERECQGCGLFQAIPPLPQGDSACCRRCDQVLRDGRADGQASTLSCALGALFLYILAMQLPFMDVRAAGHTYKATVFTGPSILDTRGMGGISVVVLLTLVVMPAVQIFLLLAVLLGLKLPRPPRLLPVLFGFLERIRPWSMTEVFLLGVFVAYTRLQVIAEVDVGLGLYALGGVMLCLIAADVALDYEQVWDALEARGLLQLRDPPATPHRIGCDICKLVLFAPSGWPCPRCGRKLRHRKRQSLGRAWALLCAATVLYVPANLLPIITVIRWGQGAPNTIIGGVLELIQYQMWPLALLVFMASIVVPIAKLVSLTTMLIMTHEKLPALLRQRTRLYRVIEAIGRWSMIDVFMLTTLVALVHMGFIATVLPGPGAAAFAAVVLLTMLAAISFDPRLMWDAAAAAGDDVCAHDTAAESEQLA